MLYNCTHMATVGVKGLNERLKIFMVANPPTKR